MLTRSLFHTFRRSTTTLPLRRTFTNTTPLALSRTFLIGRLGAEPEMTATSTGREIIRYVVGTSHGNKDNRETSWFNVTSFDEGNRRELLMSLPKGTLVYVEADTRIRTYEDGEGRKRTQFNLVQQRLDVLSRPLSALRAGDQDLAAGGAGAETDDEHMAARG